MENILKNKNRVASLLVTSVMLSTSAYAEQIGFPEHSITVSQQYSATDSEGCGTTLTPTCRTIQHAVNRIAQGGGIFVFPGTYVENILVDKAGIIIGSVEGANRTIIDGSNASNNTVSEAIRVIENGVRIGSENSTLNGFTLQNSVASGIFSIGNNVTISGNIAINNGSRGFQFGISTVDDFIDNNSKNIPDDPFNGVTFIEGDAGLQTQNNVTVLQNEARSNALGGFYFSAFDDGNVHHNTATDHQSTQGGLGQGSGFWIDSGSNSVVLSENTASSNAGSGIFYRRGGDAVLVTDQSAYANTVDSNGGHGIIFMGDNITAIGNTATNNQRDGLHFMGYDNVLAVGNNTLIGNAGAGIALENGFFNNDMTRPVGTPNILPGAIDHNTISGNRFHFVPGLADTFANCAIATNLNNGRTIVLGVTSHIGNDQEICDQFGIVTER